MPWISTSVVVLGRLPGPVARFRSARVEPIEVQQVERIEDHAVISFPLEVVLERAEIRTPIGIRRDDLAVNDELGCGQWSSFLCLFGCVYEWMIPRIVGTYQWPCRAK
jgi:hypothetical protein